MQLKIHVVRVFEGQARVAGLHAGIENQTFRLTQTNRHTETEWVVNHSKRQTWTDEVLRAWLASLRIACIVDDRLSV